MLAILSITSPIYIVIALGWLSTRLGLFERADMRVLGKFVLYVALPALLFDAVARRALSDILEWRYMLPFALGSLATLGIGLAWTRRVAKAQGADAVVQTMGMVCPNSGFVGYPINLLVLGPVAGVILGMNMVVENLLLIPLLMALAESAGGGGHWRAVLGGALRGLVRNPMVLGLGAGLLAAVLGLKLPAPAERTVTLFAQASAALSLFVIGGSLAGLQLRGLGATVARIAAGKLLLHPAMVWLVLQAMDALGVSPMDPKLRAGVVLAAACPMFGIYPILANKHGLEGVAAAALLGATLASFFTISGLLWFMQRAG